MEKSNSFSKSLDNDVKYFYEKQVNEIANNPNIDCSEVVENYLENIDGSALLILHPKWNSYGMFNIKFADGTSEDYAYHYAFRSKDNLIYDSVLGYKGLKIEQYLQKCDIDGDYELSIVEGTKTLKAYL